VFVDRDVGQLGFGHFHGFADVSKTRGLYTNFDCYRRITDLNDFAIKTYQVADVNWLMENDLAHCHGDEAAVICTSHGLDRAGLVNVTKKYTAEYCALRVGHMRHHRNAYRGVGVIGHKVNKNSLLRLTGEFLQATKNTFYTLKAINLAKKAVSAFILTENEKKLLT
jgi:hypothetical protein